MVACKHYLFVSENISFFAEEGERPVNVHILTTDYRLDTWNTVMLNGEYVHSTMRSPSIGSKFIPYRLDLVIFINSSNKFNSPGWNNVYVRYSFGDGRDVGGKKLYDALYNVSFHKQLYFKSGNLFPNISMSAKPDVFNGNHPVFHTKWL